LSVTISIVKKALGLGRKASPAPVDDAPMAEAEADHAPAPATEWSNGDVPVADPTMVMSQGLRTMFNVVHSQSKRGLRPKLLMTGPAGCGKSSLAQQFAGMTRRQFFSFEVPNVRESRDWFGCKGIGDDGRPRWFESQFAHAIRTPGSVILLDEVNRATPAVANVLLALLDHRAGTYFEELQAMIRVSPGVVWFGTANIGRQFAGTYALDGAFRDRFSTRVPVTYLGSDEEINLLISRTGIDKDTAASLVEVAGITRQRSMSDGTDALCEGISTRALLCAAQNYKDAPEGKGRLTLPFSLAYSYPSEGGENSEQAAVLSLLAGKFGELT
jgi:nitric oxide reductase NorQ protein